MKNVTSKCYLGNKEQKAMFLVVSRSDVHFGLEQLFFFFFFCVPDRASNFTCTPGKSGASKEICPPLLKDTMNKQFFLHRMVRPLSNV